MRQARALILCVVLLPLATDLPSVVATDEPDPTPRQYENSLAICAGSNIGTRGLQALALGVFPYEDAPLSLQDELQPVLASMLRDAGATVLLPGDSEYNALSRKEMVRINLKAAKSDDSAQCAWTVDIDLWQPIQLKRDPSLTPSTGIAHHQSRMGIVECSDLEDHLRATTVKFFGQFAKTYKHENHSAKLQNLENSKSTKCLREVVVCDLGLSELAKLARFRTTIEYSVAPDFFGHHPTVRVVSSTLDEEAFHPNLEAFKSCLNRWRLPPGQTYRLALTWGTTDDPTVYELQGESGWCEMRIVVP